MIIETSGIIKPEFGAIRQVYYSNYLLAYFVETVFGFQFIIKDNILVFDNVNSRIKIIGNTFTSIQVSFITIKGLYKIDCHELLKLSSSSFGVWGDYEYKSVFINELKFPFLQYFSSYLKSVEFSDRIILIDETIGIICYNVLSEEIELEIIPFKNNSISTFYNPEIYNPIYWGNIDKFEISDDEKYFFLITAYEGKSLFVFRFSDFSLIYHEIGSYALSCGVFYKDYFVVPAGYDYDADVKQLFKIVNLITGRITKVPNSNNTISDFAFGFNYQGVFVGGSQLFDNALYNGNRVILSFDINYFILSNKFRTVEIKFEPELEFTNEILKEVFINNEDIICLTWNNKYSMHHINITNLNEMEELIEAIYETLKDYRADENQPLVHMTRERIRNWINQFEVASRDAILTELDNIFKKRYCSKNEVKNFLDEVIIILTKDFGFNASQDFLKNSDFLNLQPVGKSQRIMLSLFDELIQEKYGLSLADCGTVSKKYSIYIDDILCTGLTLISDIKEWAEANFCVGKANKQAVADGSTTLVFAYVFLHKKNYQKKISEMRHKISKEVSSKHKMYRLISIENESTVSSKIDLILPLESGQPHRVTEYRNSITDIVDARSKEKGWVLGSNDFYRPANLPSEEEFFTNAENRILVENAFLLKGIEILDNANSHISNMRALGYSLPSLKDFGFGALCFTWRNVPNNTPLVFWYLGGGFTPLFMVTRGGNSIISLNYVKNPPVMLDDDLFF